MSAVARQSRCERARSWAALAPDAELSQLEQRLLDAHLAHCVPCGSFAVEIEAIALELRSAARRRPARPLALPPAHVRRSVYARVRGAGAVAAVAAMAFGISTQAALVSGEPARPATARGTAPAEVEAAELQMIRQLRRDALLGAESYPDRPSRSFGTQPA